MGSQGSITYRLKDLDDIFIRCLRLCRLRLLYMLRAQVTKNSGPKVKPSGVLIFIPNLKLITDTKDLYFYMIYASVIYYAL